MRQPTAFIAAFTAFTGWVLVDAAIKWGSEAALSPYAIMATLGFVGAASLFFLSAAQGRLSALRPASAARQGLICLFSLGINFATIIALKHLPLTLFYILALSAPLLIAGIVSVLKHEKLTKLKIACLLIGFAGVVIALAPHGADTGTLVGYVAGLTATLCFAGYTVAIRNISSTDSATSIQFWCATAFGIAGVIGCIGGDIPAWHVVIVLIAAGILNLLSNIIHSRALKYTSATNVAQFHYTQIVSGGIVAYVIWHEQPTAHLIAGSLLIIISGLIVAAQSRKMSATN